MKNVSVLLWSGLVIELVFVDFALAISTSAAQANKAALIEEWEVGG